MEQMQRDELLQKYRSERQDEGKDHVNDSTDAKAFSGMLIFAVLIIVYQVYKDVPFGDVIALLFSFLAFGGFYRYHATKAKHFLLMGVLNAAICIGFIVWYVIQTL